MDNAKLLNSNSMNQASNHSSLTLGDHRNQESAAVPEDGDEALLEMANKTLLELERTFENVDSLPSCSKEVPTIISKNNSEISDISDAEEDNPNDQTYIQTENESDSSSNDIDENALPAKDELNNTNLDENLIPEAERRSRKKRRHIDETQWKKNFEKLKRQSGQEYFGKRKLEDKWDYHVTKKPKVMKESCKCNGKTGTKCKDILKEERTKLFEKFWELSWSEKRVYITTLVEKNPVKRARNRKVESKSRRQFSYSYYLDTSKCRIRVCKTMFCNTLSISERSIGHWLHDKSNNMTLITASREDFVNPRQAKINKEKENLKAFLTVCRN
nr:unnamed protein product [Callosobruchus chinensis]